MSRSGNHVGRRVLFLYAYAHDEKDAVANAVRQLAEGLATHGFHTKVFALQPRPPRGNSKLSRVREQARYLVQSLCLVLFRRKSFDVIVTVDVPTGLGMVGRLASVLSADRVRHVGWVMDLYQFQPGATRGLSNVRRGIDRLSLSHAGELVTIGSCMADLIVLNTGRKPRVIPIWQDESWLQPSPSSWRAREAIADGLFVLYSGHAGMQHPLSELVEAVEIANRETPVTLVVAGHGDHFEELRLHARTTGTSHVEFRDPVPFSEVPAMLSAADVHVVSLAASFLGTCVPSKAYSAMAVGRPCLFIGPRAVQVATDIVAADAGVVAEAGSSARTLATILVELAANPERLSAQGVKAREYFLRERSLASQSLEWASFLRQLDSRPA